MKHTRIVALTLAAALLVSMISANAFAVTWDKTDDSKLTNTNYATWNGFVDPTYPTVSGSSVSWANTLRNQMTGTYYGTVTTTSDYASIQNTAGPRISTGDSTSFDVSYSSGSSGSGNHEIKVYHYYGTQSGQRSICTSTPQYSSQSFYRA